MTQKNRLHELVEQLPDDEVEAAERMLRGLCATRQGAGAPSRLRRPAVAIGKRKPDRRYEDIRNPELLESLEESRRDAAEGRVVRFTDVEDAIAWLHRETDPEQDLD